MWSHIFQTVPNLKKYYPLMHYMLHIFRKMEIYDKFGRYDQNKDGFISCDEAHKVLHNELGYTEERSKSMVDKFDMNRDGQVSYMEFAEFYIAVEEK